MHARAGYHWASWPRGGPSPSASLHASPEPDPPTLVLPCPAIFSLCLQTGHLPAEGRHLLARRGSDAPGATPNARMMLNTPTGLYKRAQGGSCSSFQKKLSPPGNARAGGKQEDQATPSPKSGDKTAGGEGKPGPGTSESPPEPPPEPPPVPTGHGPDCPWWRNRAPACNITKQGRLVHWDKGPQGPPGQKAHRPWSPTAVGALLGMPPRDG